MLPPGAPLTVAPDKDIKKQAENFSMKSLSETMMKLKNLDTELKSLSQDKYSLITRFVINI